MRTSVAILALVAALPSRAAGQTPAAPAADPADAFFDDTVLHDVRLTIKAKDWTSLKEHFQENDPYPIDLRWTNPRTGAETVSRGCAIRSRGTGSRSPVKPGVRVDIDYYNKGQRFLGLKSFILRNQTQDPSGMRERLSMLFFRRNGPNNFYFYRFQNTTRFMFLPWDKSNTFWEGPDYWIFRNIEGGPIEKRNRLVLRAFQEPDLRTLYLDTLLECAEKAEEGAAAASGSTPAQPGWLEQEVTREYEQIRAAALADPVKTPYTNDDFEQAVVDVKKFARERSAAVRQQVADARR